MKKICYGWFLFVCSMFISSHAWSQGTTCAAPDLISALPYTKSTTTVGSGDDYDETDACGSFYMTGMDYVFAYTPSSNQNISVTLSGTGMGVGLFILYGCPDAGGYCVAMVESGTSSDPYLSFVALASGMEYFIIVSTYDAGGFNPTTAFTINIVEIPHAQFDASINNINLPPSACSLAGAEIVQVQIKNIGTDTISNFDIAYKVDNNSPIVETYTGTITNGSTVTYNFSSLADFSQVGHTYSVKCYTSLPTDTSHTNDTMVASISHSTMVSTFPYFENFESGNGDWVPEGDNSSWERGTPAASLINSAFSGSNAWATGLNGAFNNDESSYLLSPCFDLSSLSVPMIEMKLWYEMQPAYSLLQYTLNEGYNWAIVGEGVVSVEWYDDTYPDVVAWNGQTGGWKTVKFAIDSLAGVSQVQFRLTLDGVTTGGMLVEEGIAVDDIRIYEAPTKDLGLSDIIHPTNGCNMGAVDSVTIAIHNYADFPIDSFLVAYSLDGVTYFSDSIFVSIGADSTIIHTFSASYDFSATGSYDLEVLVFSGEDENNSNDTVNKTVIHFQSVSSTGYSEDFELNNGGWVTEGNNSSWQLGAPSNSTINAAASGSNAWVTSLNGDHNNGEVSYLTSPCFDLSGITNPLINFSLWRSVDVEPFVSGVLVLEVSIDDGVSWTTVGTTGTGTNWYNSTQATGWVGNSGGWQTTSHALDSLGGVAQARFRFSFQALVGTNEGFGIDNLSIINCDSVHTTFNYFVDSNVVHFSNTSYGTSMLTWDFGDGFTSLQANPVHTYDTSGTYVATLSMRGICAMDTLIWTDTVVICQEVECVFSFLQDSLIVQFTNQSLHETSSHWYFGDSSTSNEDSPTYIYSEPATYLVSLVVKNACSSDSISALVFVDLMIEEFSSSSISIIPNPAKDKIWVELPDGFDGKVKIEIWDISGKYSLSSFETIRDSQRVEYDVSHLATGIYQIRLYTENQMITGKVAVQHY